MAKKYFVSSDIHGFFNEYEEALNKAGFDVNNPDHAVIVCGDIFDRGSQPLAVYNFLKSLPKERRILIRGNHELLLKDLVVRGYPESHDKHNGTWDTCLMLSGQMDDYEWNEYLLQNYYRDAPPYFDKDGKYKPEWDKLNKKIDEAIKERRKRVLNNPLLTEILDWIDSDEWINYYETNNYIFVHSWIPVQQYFDFDKSLRLGKLVKSLSESYREDWRNATSIEWSDAMWGCPWKKAKEKLNKTEKTIVCGHWHTSDFFNHLTKRTTLMDTYDCPIFISKRYKLIGLDACTAGSGKVNCWVVDENQI